MKISVITPSYNQAQFLPDNLRTVSGQRGVEIEHIIVDPGSTDGSTEIARTARHATLINEPDRGQSHGIAKGYARATGDILVWLNSDDFYPNENILSKVVSAFRKHPEADIIYGNVNFVGEDGKFLRKGFVNRQAESLLKSFEYQVGIVQPGVFMKRKVFEAIGGPSEDYNYCMDYEYWVRKAAAGFRWVFLDEVLAHHRWWDGMKTSSGRGESLIEHFKVCATYFGYIHHKWLDRYGEFQATNSDGVVNHAESIDIDVKNACVRRAIERFVTQDMLAQLHRSGEKEQIDTLEYIRLMAPDVVRNVFDTSELNKAVSSHPDPDANSRVAWHVFNTSDSEGRRFKTYTVPNNFSRSFSADWYQYQQQRSIEKLKRIQEQRKEVCVIVANGPSLNNSNLDLLRHADVFISNYATISKKLLKHATYLTVVNDLVAKQGAVQFNGIDTLKILPFWLANSINATDNTIFIPATTTPEFCLDIGGAYSWRSTVSFLNMQLAYTIGYKRVILIGFDHSYHQSGDLKEGDAISQKSEDPNHFDPRYFQGKTWQAADTANMEKMYVLARAAYDAAGRQIINATVGGKLEVFPRMTLEAALGVDRPAHPGQKSMPVKGAPKLSRKGAAPRLLVLDMTAMGNASATGELKSTLLAGWPDAELLQIAKQGPHGLASVRRHGAGWRTQSLDLTSTRQVIAEFAPEIILYRPVPDSGELHSVAMELAEDCSVPLVTWIMDDWPARMEIDDPAAWSVMKPALEFLLKRSAIRLSISAAMSEAFVKRYGQPFVPLANGIDPADWPVTPKRSETDGIFRLRYAGGLAPDMNRKSIYQVAEAVEQIAQSGVRISFQISTQKWWHDQVQSSFEKFRHTQLMLATLKQPEYRTWLSQADALLIAYNYDAASLRYTRYSLANKMPECLVSGAPILAYGPQETATIRYLAADSLASIVDVEGADAIKIAVLQMINHPEKIANTAIRAQSVARERHDVRKLRTNFEKMCREIVDIRHSQPTLSKSSVPGYTYTAQDVTHDWLLDLSQALLLDPDATLRRLDREHDLRKRVEDVLSVQPAYNTVVRHFAKVLGHVRSGEQKFMITTSPSEAIRI